MDNLIFKDAIEVNSIEEIISITKSKNPEKYFNVWMWRGQANIEWTLHSSAYRRLQQTESNITESDLRFYEEDSLKKASLNGYRWFNGRSLTDFELLARLQHHGAATRLIDFTRNILVAIWFVVTEHKEKDGILFGFHCHSLGGGEELPPEEIYSEFVSELESCNNSLTCVSSKVSERISAQNSQFIYSKLTNDLKGSVVFPEDKHLLIFKIPKESKSKIKKDLSEYFDIRHETIFPDLEGFCLANSSKFKYFNDRW